jgi:hypothetical protein
VLSLQQYLYRERKFLHDSGVSGGTKFDDTFLIYTINQARANLVYLSRCTRAWTTINLAQGQEWYPFSQVLASLQTSPGDEFSNQLPVKQVLTILNLTIQYSSSPLRIALEYLPWSQFNAIYRAFPIQIYPTIWSMYGYQQFIVAPIPSQTYVLEVDCLWLPSDLLNYNDNDTALPQPWSDAVPLVAAYWALINEQSPEMVEAIKKIARDEFGIQLSATPPWRIPSPYGSSFTG